MHKKIPFLIIGLLFIFSELVAGKSVRKSWTNIRNKKEIKALYYCNYKDCPFVQRRKFVTLRHRYKHTDPHQEPFYCSGCNLEFDMSHKVRHLSSCSIRLQKVVQALETELTEENREIIEHSYQKKANTHVSELEFSDIDLFCYEAVRYPREDRDSFEQQSWYDYFAQLEKEIAVKKD